MKVDLEKIKKAKGRTYINVEDCPIPICVEDYVEYKRIEKKLGIDLRIFIKCLALLNQDKFTYTYVLGKSKDCFMTAITPIQFLVDMEHKEFVETRREKGYEQHLKFKDYGKTWALTKEELTDGK